MSCSRRLSGTLRTLALLAGTGLVPAQEIGRMHPVVTKGDAARLAALQLGLPLKAPTSDGGALELEGFVDGVPQYLMTFNQTSADTISADECLPGGSTGLNLGGAGVLLGIWDAGAVRATHRELRWRVTVMNPVGALLHATHAAGTMIASGISVAARGLAPAARLRSYDWTHDFEEMDTAGAEGMSASNHSYGFNNGWFFDADNQFGLGRIWLWFGDPAVSPVEDHRFGFYGFHARVQDDLARRHPRYLIVRGAGDDRDDVGPLPGQIYYMFVNRRWTSSAIPMPPDGGASGFDTIDSQATAKNILTVGAVDDLPGGYTTPASVMIAPFSAFGPTDDGRIKPDLVANGVGVTSSSHETDSSYAVLSGTSMAAPAVTGTVALLVEERRRTLLPDLSSASLKAVLIHTANECGANPGPDYTFGWGLVNARDAAQLVAQDAITPSTISEMTLSQGQVVRIPLRRPYGGGPIKATLCWTDPPGPTPAPALDPTQKVLVNDLDLRIVNRLTDFPVLREIKYSPWVLDPVQPGAPARAGDNTRDNVEQVLATPGSLGSLYLTISHKGTLQGGPQPFTLVLTGATF